MSSLNGQELEIFRAGDYGDKGTYTSADLQQLASDYNPDQHEAPLVIGHPKTSDRAYGWCRRLRAQGDKLFGTFDQVPAAIDQAVKEGAYKKRSVAITRRSDGKLALRHVGLLGAMVPGVTGMPDAKFSDETFEEFEFSSEPGENGMAEEQQQKERNAFMDRLMKFFSGDDKGTQVVDLEKFKAELNTEFAAESDAKLKSLQAEFADYKAKHEQSDKSASVTAAINRLKAEKNWLPAFDRMGVPELFAAIGDSATVEVEFADTKDTRKKLPTLDVLSNLVGNIARLVPRGVTFGDEQAKAATEITAKTAPAGADPGSVQMDTEIRARMEKDKIDYPTAARRLASEGKSSASYASATSGAV